MAAYDLGLGRVHSANAGPDDWGNARSIIKLAEHIHQTSGELPPYGEGGWFEDQGSFTVHQPQGQEVCNTVQLPHRAILPVETHKLDTRLEGVLHNGHSMPRLLRQYWGFYNPGVPLKGSLKNRLKFNFACFTDEQLARVVLRINSDLRSSDMVTPFVKLWMYFFAAVQSISLGEGAHFGTIKEIPGVILENSIWGHAEWDVVPGPLDGTVVEDRVPSWRAAVVDYSLCALRNAQRNFLLGPLDGTVVEERVRFWRAAVVDFPAYTLRNADGTCTPSAFCVRIPGGTLRYISSLIGLNSNSQFKDWDAFPPATSWLQFISDAAEESDCQDDALHAFHLAASLACGAQDPITYRGRPAHPTGSPAPGQVLISGALHIRGAPLPKVDCTRMRLLSMLERGTKEHPLNLLCLIHPAVLTRTAILWTASLAYGLKHAMYAFGITGNNLALQPNVLALRACHKLLANLPGDLPTGTPALAMCASHIMRRCIGALLPQDLAPYLVPSVDTSTISGSITLSHIYGREPPGWVRTLHLVHRMNDVPATCGYYVLGTAPDPGITEDQFNAINRKWIADVQSPGHPDQAGQKNFWVVGSREQEAGLENFWVASPGREVGPENFWVGSVERARRMMSASAYASSTLSLGGTVAANPGSCERMDMAGLAGRARDHPLSNEWDALDTAFRREGSTPIYGLRHGVRWSYGIRSEPASDFLLGGAGEPLLWIQLTSTPHVIPLTNQPATTLRELVQRADRPANVS